MRTIKRDIVGAFIFSADGKLLLGKTGVYNKSYCVPGGGIEKGETVIEALNREISEETGVDISGEKQSFLFNSTGRSEKTLRDTGERVNVKMNFINYRVDLDAPADDVVIKAEDDFYDAEWFQLEALTSMNVSPPTIEALKRMGLYPQES